MGLINKYLQFTHQMYLHCKKGKRDMNYLTLRNDNQKFQSNEWRED